VFFRLFMAAAKRVYRRIRNRIAAKARAIKKFCS